MDLGEDWSNNEIIQAAAIGEFTSLDGIEWPEAVHFLYYIHLIQIPESDLADNFCQSAPAHSEAVTVSSLSGCLLNP